MHEDVIEYLSAAKGLCDTSRAGQRYALMREVAAVKPKGWRVFPRSMSDLRTGRKNYGNKGICTPLHSAVRTNVHLTL